MPRATVWAKKRASVLRVSLVDVRDSSEWMLERRLYHLARRCPDDAHNTRGWPMLRVDRTALHSPHFMTALARDLLARREAGERVNEPPSSTPASSFISTTIQKQCRLLRARRRVVPTGTRVGLSWVGRRGGVCGQELRPSDHSPCIGCHVSVVQPLTCSEDGLRHGRRCRPHHRLHLCEYMSPLWA
jgi:hypothetical protein